jgi:acetyl esterase/lipase
MLTRREMFKFGSAAIAATLIEPGVFGQQKTDSAQAPASIDPMSLVNPELRGALQGMLKLSGNFPPLSSSTLMKTREMMANLKMPMLPKPEIQERTIPGAPGDPDVRIYIAGVTPGASKPAVVHMHGGGYLIGTAANDGRDLQDLVIEHDCVAISVDYRLAPETPFPGALNDNYAALRWLFTHAKELGVDSTRIAIKGESAGGGHAAALAIAARDRGEYPICLQVLIYPMLDDRTGSTVTPPPFVGRYVWTAEANRYGWTSLLGVPAGSKDVPKNSVPARVQNLAGLAPAFIGVGSIDLFAEEDIQYAARLVSSGVPTELNVVPGAFHGFEFADAPLCKQFKHSWSEAIRRAFTESRS